jgi:uncharacterized small protein (DUF1192 family)
MNDTEELSTGDAWTREQAGTESDEAVVLDVDSVRTSEDRIAELEAELETYRAEVQELRGLSCDLSARVADGRDVGVCPDRHGPVVKTRGWFRPTTIECKRYDRVFFEY